MDVGVVVAQWAQDRTINLRPAEGEVTKVFHLQKKTSIETTVKTYSSSNDPLVNIQL